MFKQKVALVGADRILQNLPGNGVQLLKLSVELVGSVSGQSSSSCCRVWSRAPISLVDSSVSVVSAEGYTKEWLQSRYTLHFTLVFCFHRGYISSSVRIRLTTHVSTYLTRLHLNNGSPSMRNLDLVN